jgi:hypothetical protein
MTETNYRLEPRDASDVVTFLRSLARLVDRDPQAPGALNEGQLQSLTYPAAALPITRDRGMFGDRLREIARAIEAQLPGEAPRPGPEK